MMRDNRQVRLIVKFNPQSGAAALRRFLQELPAGFCVSAIQADGSWKPAGDLQAILRNPAPADLLVHQGDLR
jgi:hypothetical protein